MTAVRSAALLLLLASCCAATPLPDADGVDAKLEAAAGAAAAPSEVEVDAQIAGLVQQLEALQGLTPREKRAVNALLGGGGGGSFLNELNKGPTYSQLLGNSGGGFGSKLGIFSSLLGSSSGGGAGAGGEAGASGGSDSGSILGLITPLLGSSSGPIASALVNLGLSLPGGDGLGDLGGDVPPAASETMPDGEEDAVARSDAAEGITMTSGDLAAPEVSAAVASASAASAYAASAAGASDPLQVDLTSSSGGGAGAGASAGASVGLDGGLGGGLDGGDLGGGDLGASVVASIDGDAGSSAGAGAGAAGGSDSGSILGLITPLLGSSSQGGGFFGTILNSVISIKSFIFRKIVQLLGSSSGSPQAG